MDAQFGHKIGSKHIRRKFPSRSIGCNRERLIFEGIESISKKFWRYLSFGKLCPKAFSVSWGWSSLRCVTNFRTCGHKSYFEVKCLPLDTKVNHPFKILFQHVLHSTSILESFDLNLFYLRALWFRRVGIIFVKWNMQMTKRGNTVQWTFCHFEYLDKIPA